MLFNHLNRYCQKCEFDHTAGNFMQCAEYLFTCDPYGT